MNHSQEDELIITADVEQIKHWSDLSVRGSGWVCAPLERADGCFWQEAVRSERAPAGRDKPTVSPSSERETWESQPEEGSAVADVKSVWPTAVRERSKVSTISAGLQPVTARVKAFIWTLYCSFICFIWFISAFDSVLQHQWLNHDLITGRTQTSGRDPSQHHRNQPWVCVLHVELMNICQQKQETTFCIKKIGFLKYH